MKHRRRSQRMWRTSNPGSSSSGDDDDDDAVDADAHGGALPGFYENSDDEGAVSTSHFLDGREVIKDWVPMADVASLLPSVYFPLRIPKEAAPADPHADSAHGHTSEDQYYYYDGGFYFQGIPHLLVRPSALQLFARQSRQLYQFIGMHSVVIKPPKRVRHASSSPPSPRQAGGVGGGTAVDLPSAAAAVSDGDVITWEEYTVLKELDGAYAAFIVCVLAGRLWAQQRRRQRWHQQHARSTRPPSSMGTRRGSCTTESRAMSCHGDEDDWAFAVDDREEEEDEGWLVDASLLMLPDVAYAAPC
ncbi:hypothetical protein STCU_10961 [Strigomonas culicis]|uniref:Uncharacterized protein n=1 Tax=Strigomonas culicis TaxID=28005 RepID=S9TFI0_9TRYP|nr:hypothetical protein STCU_10961 [Strigomonas culicis]|eukprot:EPY16827.1 hypothetical protein STCU_10961 [Strigomonas culicis]